jgi:hypothetical protein
MSSILAVSKRLKMWSEVDAGPPAYNNRPPAYNDIYNEEAAVDGKPTLSDDKCGAKNNKPSLKKPTVPIQAGMLWAGSLETTEQRDARFAGDTLPAGYSVVWERYYHFVPSLTRPPWSWRAMTTSASPSIPSAARGLTFETGTRHSRIKMSRFDVIPLPLPFSSPGVTLLRDFQAKKDPSYP